MKAGPHGDSAISAYPTLSGHTRHESGSVLVKRAPLLLVQRGRKAGQRAPYGPDRLQTRVLRGLILSTPHRGRTPALSCCDTAIMSLHCSTRLCQCRSRSNFDGDVGMVALDGRPGLVEVYRCTVNTPAWVETLLQRPSELRVKVTLCHQSLWAD